jgi:hypothetical protein
MHLDFGFGLEMTILVMWDCASLEDRLFMICSSRQLSMELEVPTIEPQALFFRGHAKT